MKLRGGKRMNCFKVLDGKQQETFRGAWGVSVSHPGQLDLPWNRYLHQSQGDTIINDRQPPYYGEESPVKRLLLPLPLLEGRDCSSSCFKGEMIVKTNLPGQKTDCASYGDEQRQHGSLLNNLPLHGSHIWWEQRIILYFKSPVDGIGW